MRMNREEIVNIANDVKNRMGSDVRNQLNNLIRKRGTSVEELSATFNINGDDIRRILGGNFNVSLDTFVKIMVATGNVVEVKPLMPRGHGRMPLPRMDGNVRRDHSMGGGRPMPFPFPPMNESHSPWEDEPTFESDAIVETPSMEFHSKSREELVDIVCDLGLENEIDLRRATRSALINFLAANTSRNAENVQRTSYDNTVNCDGPCNSEITAAQNRVVSNDKEYEFAKVMDKIANMMSANPQLMEKMTKLFGD